MDAVKPDEDFRRFLAEGRFMIQRSEAGRHTFFPRVAEPGTGAELHWVEASGRGVVYATTVVVILTSLFFGIYLFLIDQVFFNLVQWILRRFGAI